VDQPIKILGYSVFWSPYVEKYAIAETEPDAVKEVLFVFVETMLRLGQKRTGQIVRTLDRVAGRNHPPELCAMIDFDKKLMRLGTEAEALSWIP